MISFDMSSQSHFSIARIYVYLAKISYGDVDHKTNRRIQSLHWDNLYTASLCH